MSHDNHDLDNVRGIGSLCWCVALMSHYPYRQIKNLTDLKFIVTYLLYVLAIRTCSVGRRIRQKTIGNVERFCSVALQIFKLSFSARKVYGILISVALATQAPITIFVRSLLACKCVSLDLKNDRDVTEIP